VKKATIQILFKKKKFTSEFAFCVLKFIISSDRAIGKLPNLCRSQVPCRRDDFGEFNINNLKNLISLIILSLNNGTLKILISGEMEIGFLTLKPLEEPLE